MRSLNALRPPPGGAMAASSCMSCTFFTSCFARSYQNPLSTHSLSSSSGGMKPNTLFLGMLKSSMKQTSFLPPAGANTPLVRFSSLPSIVSCRLLLLVCALKLITMLARPSGRPPSTVCAIIDLPTPTPPTMRQCRSAPTSAPTTNLVRTVSMVGIMILKNGSSGGGR